MKNKALVFFLGVAVSGVVVAAEGKLNPTDSVFVRKAATDKASSDAFDKAYMRATIADHQQDVSDFRQESVRRWERYRPKEMERLRKGSSEVCDLENFD